MAKDSRLVEDYVGRYLGKSRMIDSDNKGLSNMFDSENLSRKVEYEPSIIVANQSVLDGEDNRVSKEYINRLITDLMLLESDINNLPPLMVEPRLEYFSSKIEAEIALKDAIQQLKTLEEQYDRTLWYESLNPVWQLIYGYQKASAETQYREAWIDLADNELDKALMRVSVCGPMLDYIGRIEADFAVNAVSGGALGTLGRSSGRTVVERSAEQLIKKGKKSLKGSSKGVARTALRPSRIDIHNPVEIVIEFNGKLVQHPNEANFFRACIEFIQMSDTHLLFISKRSVKDGKARKKLRAAIRAFGKKNPQYNIDISEQDASHMIDSIINALFDPKSGTYYMGNSSANRSFGALLKNAVERAAKLIDPSIKTLPEGTPVRIVFTKNWPDYADAPPIVHMYKNAGVEPFLFINPTKPSLASTPVGTFVEQTKD